jgi:hemolysin III
VSSQQPSTPTFAPAREPVNGWLHVAGALLAAVGLVVLAAAAQARRSPRHVLAAGVFGTTALLMFAASALYHLAPRSKRGPQLRRLDHAMVYVFIAGTYTPVCLLALRGTPLAAPLLACAWTVAALGVAQKVAWAAAPRGLSTGLYLALGWLGVVAVPTLVRQEPALFAWLFAGGALYTVGAFVYWAKWPRGVPGVFGWHELWHVFVLAAWATHYWAVFAYIIPLG